MAPKWYQANNTTWWGWSYVADLGPYSGPVPPSYPLWVPDAAAELDFVVGIPHPSGDPRLFRDGSYSAGGFSGSYAYHFAPGPLDGTGAYGGTSLEAGDHLFVQFYFMGYPFTGTLPPKMPALSLVPSTLIAGGYGPTIENSGWSPWQSRFDAELVPPVEVWPLYYRLSNQNYLSTADGGTDTRDGQAILNSVRDALMAADTSGSGVETGRTVTLPSPPFAPGTTVDADFFTAYSLVGETDSFGREAGWGTTEVGAFAEGGGHVYGYGTGVGMGYVGQNVNGSALIGQLTSDPPPALSGLTGQYTTIPVDQVTPRTVGFVDYEDTDTTFERWLTVSYQNDVDMHCDPVGGTVPETIPVSVWWTDPDASQLATATPPTLPTRPWLGYEAGTVIEHLDLNAPPGTTSDPFYVETTQTVVIDLSAVPNLDFALVMQPRWMSSAVDVPGPFAAGGATYASTQHMNGTDSFGYNYLDVKDLRSMNNPPSALWRMPRWRYWRPGTLTFHCPGGARPRITVTEGHWSDWIEGDLVTPNTSYRIHPQGQWDENLFTESYSTSGVFGAPPPPGGTLPVAWPDIAAYMDSELAGARAGTLARFDGADNAGIDLSLFKRWLYSGGPDVTYQEWVGSFRVFQDVATYDASSLLVGYDSDYYGYFARHGISNYGPNPITGLIYDGESSTSTVLGWEDWDSTLTTIGDAPSWQDFQIAEEGSAVTYPPPSSTPISMPFLIRASSAPLAPTTDSYSLDSSLHFLDSSDGALLTTVTLPATGGSSSITIPLSDLGPVPGFTIFFRPQLLESGSIPFGDPTMPSSPYTWSRESRVRGRVQNLSSYTYNFLDPSARGNVPIIRIRRPRWRYWIPALTDIQCEQAVLRLGQRNDGRGPYAHPRLDSSKSAPSSVQRSAAPRLGSNNRYQ